MESMKKMENIKPAYAVKLGAGVFAGANWQCTKCGAMSYGNTSTPAPQNTGRCPETSSGNHIWRQV